MRLWFLFDFLSNSARSGITGSHLTGSHLCSRRLVKCPPTMTTKNKTLTIIKVLFTTPMRQLGLLGQFLEEERQKLQNEKRSKLMLLLEHFRIDPASESCWLQLALALAEKHVPGFQPPPTQQGRPKERAEYGTTLVLLVGLLRTRDRLSVRAAIRKIAAAGCISGSEEKLRDLYKRAARRTYTNDATVVITIIDGFTKEYGPDFVAPTLETIVGHLLPSK